MKVKILLFCLTLTLSACHTPTSPTPPVPPPASIGPEIQSAWDNAKGWLYSIGYTGVAGHNPDEVTWIATDGQFECAGDLANGCFWGEGYGSQMELFIQYNINTVEFMTLDHESAHALLYLAGEPRYVWTCALIEERNFCHPGYEPGFCKCEQ
jgi:hypothetical protein